MRDDTREGERQALLAVFQAAYPHATVTRQQLLITAYPPYNHASVGGWGWVQRRFHDELREVGFSPAGARAVRAASDSGHVEQANPPAAPMEAPACESRPIVLAMLDGAAFRKAHQYNGDFDGDLYGYFEIAR